MAPRGRDPLDELKKYTRCAANQNIPGEII